MFLTQIRYPNILVYTSNNSIITGQFFNNSSIKMFNPSIFSYIPKNSCYWTSNLNNQSVALKKWRFRHLDLYLTRLNNQSVSPLALERLDSWFGALAVLLAAARRRGATGRNGLRLARRHWDAGAGAGLPAFCSRLGLGEPETEREAARRGRTDSSGLWGRERRGGTASGAAVAWPWRRLCRTSCCAN